MTRGDQIASLESDLVTALANVRATRVHLEWMALYESMGIGAACLARIGAAVTLALACGPEPGDEVVQALDDLECLLRRMSGIVEESLAETERDPEMMP